MYNKKYNFNNNWRYQRKEGNKMQNTTLTRKLDKYKSKFPGIEASFMSVCKIYIYIYIDIKLSPMPKEERGVWMLQREECMCMQEEILQGLLKGIL